MIPSLLLLLIYLFEASEGGSVLDKIKGAATGLVKGSLDYCGIDPTEGNIINVKAIQIPGIGYRTTFKAQCIDGDKEWSITGSAYSTIEYHRGKRITRLTGDDRCDKAKYKHDLEIPENNIKLHRQACNEQNSQSNEIIYTFTSSKELQEVDGCAIDGSNKGASLHIDMETQSYYFRSSTCRTSTKNVYLADVLTEEEQVEMLKQSTTEEKCMLLLKRLVLDGEDSKDMIDALACKKVAICTLLDYQEYTGADEACIARVGEGSNGMYVAQGGIDDYRYDGPARKAIGHVMKVSIKHVSNVHEVCDNLNRLDKLKLAQSVSCFGVRKRKRSSSISSTSTAKTRNKRIKK